MPTFREVGDVLKERFDGAAEVRLQRSVDGLRARLVPSEIAYKGSFILAELAYCLLLITEPSKVDLVYSQASPDYCTQRDPLTGMPATYGRRCNETSNGIDGCELLCCRRGYTSQVR